MEQAPAPTSVAKFTLNELAEDWHFFNHGALFRYCGMEYPKQDPVADWYARQEIGTDVLLQPFKTLLFDGLNSPIHVGPLTWGHVICGVKHPYWEDFLNFMGGVATMDRRKKLYAQTFVGDINILDPVLVERSSVLDPKIPLVSVSMFCADTNKERWEIRPPATVAGRPRFVQRNPREEVVQMGRAVLSGDIEHLQHKDNPAFQPLLDKYTELTGGKPNGDQHRSSNGGRRRLGDQGRGGQGPRIQPG
jgi:hypothetical protein